MKKIKEIVKKIPWIAKIYTFLYLIIRNNPLYYYRSKKLYSSLNPNDYTPDKFKKTKLEIIDFYQKIKFEEQSKDLYSMIINKYSHPHWRKTLFFFSFLLKNLNEKYLRNQDLMYHIGVGHGISKVQLTYTDYIINTDDFMSKFFINKFTDSKVGFPLVSLLSKTNRAIKAGSIDQLFYLTRIFRYAEKNNIKINSILEFGGGFGDLAYCARSFDINITYTIIDFPEMLSLQYLYHKINYPLVPIYEYDTKRGIISGALNLVPIYKIEELTNINIDLFISTFALTETNEALINFVSQKYFFKPKIVYLQGGISTSFDTYKIVNKYIKSLITNTDNDLLARSGFFEILGTLKENNNYE